MHFNSFYTALARRLGERDDLIPYMEFERDLAIATLEKLPVKPWFLETELASTTTIAGEERLPLPGNFLAEMELQGLWLEVEGNWQVVEKCEYDDLFSRFGVKQGVPRYYAIVGKYFALFPVPDGSYPVRMRYYGKVDAQEWLENAPELLMAEMGKQMAGKYLHNLELAQVFAADKQEAIEMLIAEQVAREEVNKQRRMF